MNIRYGVACLALTLLLAGCGGSSHPASSAGPVASSATTKASATTNSSAATDAPKAGAVKLAIKNFAFKPPTITVAAGTKLTFTNDDKTAHTATSTATGAFDTGTINPGHSATVVLKKPGTYTYYCQFHAFMRGTVIVK
jgi:plastocyanin